MEIDRLEQLLSRFVPSSDISRLNAARPGESVFQPTLPAGWAKINGDLYCTAHVVLVDGKAPQ